MNKAIVLGVLIASFTIASCSKDNNVTSTDDPELSGEGGVAFTFTSSNAKIPGAMAYTAEVDSLPEATNVRVIIRRYDIDEYGNAELKYNSLGDVEVPTDTTMVLRVPAGVGYQIDAFSYVDSLDYYKYLLKHQLVEGIEVVADSVTQVSLILQPIIPNFVLPDSVEKGDGFKVEVDFNTFGKGADSWQYYGQLTWLPEYNDELIRDLYPAEWGSFNWETDYKIYEWNISESEVEEVYIYYKSLFTLEKPEFYRSSENNGIFKFSYPNPFLTNDTLKTYIKGPEGGVGVNVTY